MFESKVYQQRRDELIRAMQSGVLLFLGNEESPMNYKDNAYPFRQDSSFLYYFGLDIPNLAAIIDAEEGSVILFGDDFTLDHIIWMGPQPGIADLGARCGIDHTKQLGELVGHLEKVRAQDRDIHYLPAYRAENSIKLSRLLHVSLEEIQENPSVPLIKAVVKQRSIKSTQELAEMEEAVNISGAMHIAAMKTAKAGMKEAQIAGLIGGIAQACGGQNAYHPIITINGQTLHNHFHGNTLQPGQLLLGDFGAENHMRYAGDITRTIPVDKTFSTQQKEIYQIVLNAEINAINAIRPGVPYREIHLKAAEQMAEGLKSLGFMQGDMAEAVAVGAHALFYPHGLGHMIGLDVHDMEDLGEEFVGYGNHHQRSTQFGLKSLRLARELEPGFALTIEPGLYFIPELIQKWEAEKRYPEFINYEKAKQYLGFSGVRIEDNVVVTEAGHRVLGKPIPKTVEEVEGLRNS